MDVRRIFYRTRQFWQTLWMRPADHDLAQIGRVLSSAQMALFTGMQPSEQAHSIQVYQKMSERGEAQSGLLAAALLHDVGKVLYPLSLWERVVIVAAKAFAPGLVKRWGSAPVGESFMRSWRRAFVIAEQHPEWGAKLAERAGSSPFTVTLIRMHQGELSCGDHAEWLNAVQQSAVSCDDEILRSLRVLQSADDES